MTKHTLAALENSSHAERVEAIAEDGSLLDALIAEVRRLTQERDARMPMPLCQAHREALLQRCGIGPEDLARLAALGCLACVHPEVFERAVHQGATAAVTAMGARAVARAERPEEGQ